MTIFFIGIAVVAILVGIILAQRAIHKSKEEKIEDELKAEKQENLVYEFKKQKRIETKKSQTKHKARVKEIKKATNELKKKTKGATDEELEAMLNNLDAINNNKL